MWQATKCFSNFAKIHKYCPIWEIYFVGNIVSTWSCVSNNFWRQLYNCTNIGYFVALHYWQFITNDLALRNARGLPTNQISRLRIGLGGSAVRAGGSGVFHWSCVHFQQAINTLTSWSCAVRAVKPSCFIREGSHYDDNQRELLVISGEVIWKCFSFIAGIDCRSRELARNL